MRHSQWCDLRALVGSLTAIPPAPLCAALADTVRTQKLPRLRVPAVNSAIGRNWIASFVSPRRTVYNWHGKKPVTGLHRVPHGNQEAPVAGTFATPWPVDGQYERLESCLTVRIPNIPHSICSGIRCAGRRRDIRRRPLLSSSAAHGWTNSPRPKWSDLILLADRPQGPSFPPPHKGRRPCLAGEGCRW